MDLPIWAFIIIIIPPICFLWVCLDWFWTKVINLSDYAHMKWTREGAEHKSGVALNPGRIAPQSGVWHCCYVVNRLCTFQTKYATYELSFEDSGDVSGVCRDGDGIHEVHGIYSLDFTGTAVWLTVAYSWGHVEMSISRCREATKDEVLAPLTGIFVTSVGVAGTVELTIGHDAFADDDASGIEGTPGDTEGIPLRHRQLPDVASQGIALQSTPGLVDDLEADLNQAMDELIAVFDKPPKTTIAEREIQPTIEKEAGPFLAEPPMEYWPSRTGLRKPSRADKAMARVANASSVQAVLIPFKPQRNRPKHVMPVEGVRETAGVPALAAAWVAGVDAQDVQHPSRRTTDPLAEALRDTAQVSVEDLPVATLMGRASTAPPSPDVQDPVKLS